MQLWRRRAYLLLLAEMISSVLQEGRKRAREIEHHLNILNRHLCVQ